MHPAAKRPRTHKYRRPQRGPSEVEGTRSSSGTPKIHDALNKGLGQTAAAMVNYGPRLNFGFLFEMFFVFRVSWGAGLCGPCHAHFVAGAGLCGC